MWTWTSKPSSRWGNNRGQLPPVRCQTASLPATGTADGPMRLSGRTPLHGPGVTQSIIMSRATRPKAIGKPGCPRPRPAQPTRDPAPTARGAAHPTPTPLPPPPHPRPLIIRPQPAASRAPTASLRDRARATLDPTTHGRSTAPIRGREENGPRPTTLISTRNTFVDTRLDAGKRMSADYLTVGLGWSSSRVQVWPTRSWPKLWCGSSSVRVNPKAW